MTRSRDPLTGRVIRRRVRVSRWVAPVLALLGGGAVGALLAYPSLTGGPDDLRGIQDPLVLPTTLPRLSEAHAVASTARPTSGTDHREGNRLRPHPRDPGDPGGISLVPCSPWRPLQMGSGSVRDLCSPAANPASDSGLAIL